MAKLFFRGDPRDRGPFKYPQSRRNAIRIYIPRDRGPLKYPQPRDIYIREQKSEGENTYKI